MVINMLDRSSIVKGVLQTKKGRPRGAAQTLELTTALALWLGFPACGGCAFRDLGTFLRAEGRCACLAPFETTLTAQRDRSGVLSLRTGRDAVRLASGLGHDISGPLVGIQRSFATA